MRFGKRLLWLLAAVLLAALLTGAAAPRDGWVRDGNNWYYYRDGEPLRDGMYAVDVDDEGRVIRCIFEEDGRLRLAYGWQTATVTGDDGAVTQVRCYLDEGCICHEGWLKDGDNWYAFQDGAMLTYGIQYLRADHAFYFFNRNSTFARRSGWYSRQEVDWTGEGTRTQWYYFKDGKGVTGWDQNAQGYYYLYGGYMLSNIAVEVAGDVYVFDADGYVAEPGWQQVAWGSELHDSRVLVNPDGTLETGWFCSAAGWHYRTGGRVVANTTLLLGGKSYTFDENGVWIGEQT